MKNACGVGGLGQQLLQLDRINLPLVDVLYLAHLLARAVADTRIRCQESLAEARARAPQPRRPRLHVYDDESQRASLGVRGMAECSRQRVCADRIVTRLSELGTQQRAGPVLTRDNDNPWRMRHPRIVADMRLPSV